MIALFIVWSLLLLLGAVFFGHRKTQLTIRRDHRLEPISGAEVIQAAKRDGYQPAQRAPFPAGRPRRA